MTIRERAGGETSQRLEAMAVRAEQEVAARRDAAQAYPAGGVDHIAQIGIASRREADAQALRAALALAEFALRVTAPETRIKLAEAIDWQVRNGGGPLSTADAILALLTSEPTP